MFPSINKADVIWRIIKEYQNDFKRMPTVKELCFDARISKGTMHTYLAVLEKQGKLIRSVPSTIPYVLSEKLK